MVKFFFGIMGMIIGNIINNSTRPIREGKDDLDFFDDIICYGGKFYAVDRGGRLLMINPTDMEVVAVISLERGSSDIRSSYSVDFTSTKGGYGVRCTYLVESAFRLYMFTNMIESPVHFEDDDDGDDEVEGQEEECACVWPPRKFRVYVLNEREKSWERVDSLGNKVFFVSGDNVLFSATATDLGLSIMGNCIIADFATVFDGMADSEDIASVYTLEDEAIVTCDSPTDHWTSIFCPSMTWFVQNEEFPECEMQD